ncbi:helix-turn-helix transcriptional regulator [Spirosoma aureum]|uniref:Helix-turn-helix transcriptional regulator n=1 Tax=Spirosoma aureum TaxID=2692134 RepID=A0A6G9AQR6_9BACT|nr:AraC family transcriptional regulator [Spirosoma aureum]QIP14817.1 helix-turn-helix transcriptional regulator [Spirosoma aureum]
MSRQFVSCSSIIDQTTSPFVIYHQQLGCFHSDWHQHSWGQLIYAEKGCVHLTCVGKTILLPGWYGAWIPADTYHEIWSDSVHLHMRAICFPVSPVNKSLNDQLSVFPVSALLREMIRYTEKWSQSDQEELPVHTFLQAIQNLLPDEIKKAIPVCLPSTRHEKLAQVIDYIQLHLSEKVNIQQIARHFGLSVRTLTRLFTQQLGTSFSSFCKIARIMKALELIETGHDNVSQLADLVGYESLSTFSNNFLEICGNRPLQFIQEKRR